MGWIVCITMSAFYMKHDIWSEEMYGQVDIWSDVPPKVISVRCSENMFLSTLNYLTPKIQISQFLSDWEPSKIYISIWFLYKFENLEAYISLNIDIFYIFLSGMLGIDSEWSDMAWQTTPPPKMRHRTSLTFGQMRCRVRLTFNQMYSPLGWDLGSGWHLVRWLVGWPIAAGRLADWLVGHLIKWHLVRCTSPRWDVGPVWHLVRCTPPKWFQ